MRLSLSIVTTTSCSFFLKNLELVVDRSFRLFFSNYVVIRRILYFISFY
jgi:hypothetical protein